ncbi:MAG: AAA family ATPase [Kiritimatiellales bacterium]
MTRSTSVKTDLCNMTPCLILLVGLPRSGKSTWAAGQNHPVVSRDAIRLQLHGKPFFPEHEEEVSRIEEQTVRDLIAAGHRTVIIDATHFRQEYIDRWKTGEWTVETRIFDTPRTLCIQRAIQSDRPDLVKVIHWMCSETDIPELNAAAAG